MMNAYIHDILTQPTALRFLADQVSLDSLVALKQRIEDGEFDRIVLSGMGASYYAAYPAYLQLAVLPIPVMVVNAAELVNYLPGLTGPRTLLWLNSQSGRSAELLHLVEKLVKTPVAAVVACVNDPESPLAKGADYCFPIYAGEESTVSVKTYTNMLAVNLMVALVLTGKSEIPQLKLDLLETADKMQAILDNHRDNQEWLAKAIENIETLFFLGRGASMAAVWTGSLINKEAARCSFEGMNAADFRHGPLEMVRAGVGTFIFAGDLTSYALNRQLGVEIQQHGGSVIWLDAEQNPDLSTFLLPDVPELFRPLVEVIPMQLLTLIMAEKKGIAPGVFHIVGKITHVE
jgi:glucosamine--fructose-6-phosphate aminotransferase (isomerizing)